MGLSLEEQYLLLEDENRVKAEQLILQLYSDDITGLGNRNALLRDLDHYKNAFVSILNVRGFKNINDVFGFKAGNQILQELSEKYRDILGEECLVYRVSNDEFALLNKNTLSEKEFISLIEKTIEEIDKTIFVFQGIDIGLNLYSGISLDREDKLAKATVALNQAKERRVKYIIYSKDNDTKDIQAKNIEMTNEISYALRHDNMVPYFQGIADRNGKIFKYEALVRMINRENQVVSPYFFLDISKKTNMYIDITKTVIEKTFEKFKNSDKQFSINLTAIDILNPEVMALIEGKLQSFKNTEQVVFELVESDDLYNLKEIGVFLQFIKEKGAKIAIDDFGTGYSNFSYIIEIKPDYLKIDGSLIKNIDTDRTAYKTVQTIINFAHDLDIIIVAEFIHNKEVFDICLSLGVDEFQGYYFSEPQEDIV
jgi:diguanylate cyclase (GGDEF)-like protein